MPGNVCFPASFFCIYVKAGNIPKFSVGVLGFQQEQCPSSMSLLPSVKMATAADKRNR